MQPVVCDIHINSKLFCISLWLNVCQQCGEFYCLRVVLFDIFFLLRVSHLSLLFMISGWQIFETFSDSPTLTLGSQKKNIIDQPKLTLTNFKINILFHLKFSTFFLFKPKISLLTQDFQITVFHYDLKTTDSCLSNLFFSQKPANKYDSQRLVDSWNSHTAMPINLEPTSIYKK